MDCNGQNITDWTHRPSGGDLLDSTHPQVPLWCRVSQLATAMWRRIRIAIMGKAGSIYQLMSNHIRCATMCQSFLLFVFIFHVFFSGSFPSLLPSPSSPPSSTTLSSLPSFSLSPSSTPSSSSSSSPSSSSSSSPSSSSSSSLYSSSSLFSSSSSSSSSSSPHCAGSPGCWCTLVHSQKRTGDKGCVRHGGQNIG